MSRTKMWTSPDPRAIRQVLRQTVQMELRWNRRISYTKASVFGPVRETVEETP